MRSLRLVTSECSLSGRGQGHVSIFYIVNLENFSTASRLYSLQVISTTRRGWFVYDISIRQWKRLDRVTVECTCLSHIVPL